MILNIYRIVLLFAFTSCSILKKTNYCATSILRIDNFNSLLANNIQDSLLIVKNVDLLNFYNTSDTTLAFTKWKEQAQAVSNMNSNLFSAETAYYNYSVGCKLKGDNVEIRLISADSNQMHLFNLKNEKDELRIFQRRIIRGHKNVLNYLLLK